MRSTRQIRTIWAVVVVAAFSIQQAWAQAASQMPFDIPDEFAKIEKVNQVSANGPWVIHIQDPHCVIEAQRNIQKLINYLETKYNVRHVYIEGGEGRLDPSRVRVNPENRREALNDYLNLGQMSGAELAAILSRKNGRYFGIENQGLLEANRKTFIRVIEARDQRDELLKSVDSILKAKRLDAFATPLVVSQEALDLDEALRQIELFHSASRLELTRQAYEEFITAYRALAQGKGLVARYLGRPDLVRSVTELCRPMLEFYDLVLRRDLVMAANVLRRFQVDRPRIAVLVTGGFHAEGVDRILQSKNISTVVVTPKFKNLKGKENYIPAIKRTRS